MKSFALALALALLALSAACDGGSTNPSTPTAASTSGAPGATASPSSENVERVAGVEVKKWRVLPPQPLPAGTALIIEKGCTQCDGPTEAIERVTAQPDGSYEAITIFVAPGGPERYIHSTFIAPAAREMWVTVCSRGYCGGVGQATADAQVTFHHSTDGGATWKAEGTRDGTGSITAVTALGPLLVESSLNSTTGAFSTTYRLLTNGVTGEGMVIQPPAGASSLYYPQPAQQLLWLGADNRSVLRSDGTVILKADIGGHDSTGGVFPLGAPSPDFTSLTIGWTHRDQARTRPYQGFVRSGALVGVFTGLRLNAAPYPGAWLDATQAYGTVPLDPSEVPGITPLTTPPPLAPVPVQIDYAKGEITPLPIYGPLFSDAYRGRNTIRAAVLP